MITYLERYQEFASAGYGNSRIWAELTSLGADIRQEPLYSDARAVARETMTRARHNVETLIGRLNTLEYRFLNSRSAWIVPDQASLAALDALENQYGLLPLSLRMWYETVGSVDFMGTHPELSYDDSPDRRSSRAFYSDPLVIHPFNDPPLSFYADLAFNETGEDTTAPPYCIWLAPDEIQKANLSGGGPTQIMFPNPAIDAPLISEDWDGTLFVNYLRICFQWGGFPGWRNYPDYPKEEIDFLTKDLLPL
jgi:hypothetical protein